MKSAADIIVRPVVTERSLAGVADKKYTFEVAKGANKTEIKKAVEDLFGVKVKSVNTVSMLPKPKSVGVHKGYTSAWKKAIVTLTSDSKSIEFFDGMM